MSFLVWSFGGSRNKLFEISLKHQSWWCVFEVSSLRSRTQISLIFHLSLSDGVIVPKGTQKNQRALNGAKGMRKTLTKSDKDGNYVVYNEVLGWIHRLQDLFGLEKVFDVFFLKNILSSLTRHLMNTNFLVERLYHDIIILNSSSKNFRSFRKYDYLL